MAAPTFGAAGTAASGTTSAAPSYPAGISAATSKLYCFVTGRSNTAANVPTMPAGWTNIADFEGGTGTWGVDTGTRRVTVFRKDVVTGSESGTQTVSLAGTTANTLRATIVRFEVTSGYSVAEAVSTGADTTNGTGFSAAGSSSIDFAPDDLLAILVAQNRDTGTQSSQSITASGITFGTRTNRASVAVTNGNDHRHILDTVPVSSGSGTVAPTYAYTVSAAASGPVAFLRLRETPLAPTVLTKGTNGSAASSATTDSVTTTAGVGQLLAVAVTPNAAGADTDFTISGWTKVHQVNFNPADLERSVSLWSKAGVGGSESATITAPAGETYQEFRWIWMEWAGLGSLTQATSATGNSSSPSVTLGSFGAGSGTLEIVGSASVLNPTVGSGFAHIDEQSGSVQGDFLTVGWRPDADTSVDASSSTGSDFWGIIGVELVPGTWPSGGTIESRTLSSSGVGAFSPQSASIASVTLASAGASTPTFVSAAFVPAALSSGGTGAATFDAAAIYAQSFTAAGSAADTWQSAALQAVTLSSSGSGAASFDSAALALSALLSDGTGAVAWASAASHAQTFSSAGAASVSWIGEDANSGIAERTFAADGAATASWQAASVAAAALTSAGQGNATWQGAQIEARTFSASGTAAVSFEAEGAVIEARIFSAAGAASVVWLGEGQTAGSGQPVHEIDISDSPLWWQRRKTDDEPAEKKDRKQIARRDDAKHGVEQARQVIERAARRHVETGDLSKDARYADVRLALKPLGQSRPPEWAAMYEALYSLALNDAIARELEIEMQLRDEDDALVLLMVEP